MPQIPSPIVFRLDPNDENLILTMPSEPMQDSASSEQDNTPKKVISCDHVISGNIKSISQCLMIGGIDE